MSAADHSVDDHGDVGGWDNHACHYTWISGNSTSQSEEIMFGSPFGCIDDDWYNATGTVSDTASNIPGGSAGRTIELTFALANGTHRAARGGVSQDCDLIDMDDGGLFFRGEHPIDQTDHAWLKTATAWLMRAALLRFNDGTVCSLSQPARPPAPPMRQLD
jgi:hypothetical protein